MKTLKARERAMNLTMAVLMSAAMGVIAAYLVRRSNPGAAASMSAPAMYGTHIALSVLLGLVIAAAVPLGKLGAALAGKANAHPPGIAFTLLNALPFAAGNTVLISLPLSFLGVCTARARIPAEALAQLPPLPVMWLGSWVRLLFPTLIAGYVIAVVLSPIVAAAVGLNRPPARNAGK